MVYELQRLCSTLAFYLIGHHLNQNPEQKARDRIDSQLIACGWIIQDKTKLNLSAGIGVAVREIKFDAHTPEKASNNLNFCIYRNHVLKNGNAKGLSTDFRFKAQNRISRLVVVFSGTG